MSLSAQKCCVPGCMESGNSHTTLHLFPNPKKERERFNVWVFSVMGDIIGLPNDEIYKLRRVCHAHFEEKFCCRYNRISNIAVPTLNLPGVQSETLNILQIDKEEKKKVYASVKENIRKKTENIESLTLQKFERRPMTQMQYGSEPIPSTSTSSAGLQMEYTTPSIISVDNNDKIQLSYNSLKENIDPTVLQHQSSLELNKENTSKADKIIYKDCLKTKKKIVRSKKICMPSDVERSLHKKLVQVGIKLSKCRNKVRKQAVKIKGMQNILSHPQLLKTLDSWPSTAKILTLLQFREYKKGTKGRRFTLEEKILALSIFKQSPKGYRFFRKIFILPSPQTLTKLLNMADIKPGINKRIVQQIKKATEKMKIENRLCVVLFDEMSLKSNVTYNEKKDRVTGFVTNGIETRPEFADHAQVFLIRGLIKNYKQPIAYTFSQAATKGPELATQLKAVITSLQEAGLIVVATVCDQGTNNMQCIKLLMQESRASLLKKGEEHKEKIFFVNNQEIIPLYDPPHLMKCIRNNLITKDLKCGSKTAKWSHITSLHNENPGYRGIRLVPKLTDFHCIPNKIPRMKVKYATQVFSQTVATNMGYLAEKGILSAECKETANILIFFDELFDSVNGSFGKRKKYGKPLLGPATPTSIHHQVWAKSKKVLKSMKFYKSSSQVEYVPTLKNWVWTLEAIELLIGKMSKNYGINSIWLRHLNQDPIENLFGSIRSHGCRNVNPSPDKFEAAFTTVLVNSCLSSVHAPGANCEKDNCDMLSNIIITDSDCKELNVCELSKIPDVMITPLEEKNDPRKIGGLQYVTGYFLKKAKKNVFKGCNQCKKDLINEHELEYIKYREYANKKWLCSPSHSLLSCVSSLQDINYAVIKENLDQHYLSELIKTVILMFVDFDFINCELHKEDLINYLIKICCRFFIFNYCKEINKILSNKRECDDDEDLYKIKAKKYFHKCFKRKNK